MGNVFNNLSLTAVGSASTATIGKLFDTLQTKLANGGRDNNCKFYYGSGKEGSMLLVAARAAVGGVVSELRAGAENSFNSLLNKGRGKKDEEWKHGEQWRKKELDKQQEEQSKYGKMLVNNGSKAIMALDDWGCVAPEALMLGIPLQNKIPVSQTYYEYTSRQVRTDNGRTKYVSNAPTRRGDSFQSDTLVWYDTTAIININSDRNVVLTKVVGRDYSRKELVSNGDIKFTVSGQISSGMPDIYPSEEIKKFIQVMQYKGIVRVNNEILDQFGIQYILITDFNISAKEGYKSLQNYSFSAVGLQPEAETAVSEDTIEIIPQAIVKEEDKNESGWKDLLKNQLEGLKDMASDLFSQGLGLASGMLENKLHLTDTGAESGSSSSQTSNTSNTGSRPNNSNSTVSGNNTNNDDSQSYDYDVPASQRPGRVETGVHYLTTTVTSSN